jgi:hypothetical protein
MASADAPALAIQPHTLVHQGCSFVMVVCPRLPDLARPAKVKGSKSFAAEFPELRIGPSGLATGERPNKKDPLPKFLIL